MTPIEQQRSRFYNPTPYVNYNSEAVQNLLGNFFAPNATPYRNPQYQSFPTYGGQAMIPAEAQRAAVKYLLPIGAVGTAAGGYLVNQMTQNGLLRAGTGSTPSGVAGMTGSMTALKLLRSAMFAASRFGAPAVKAVNALANSPAGKWGAKLFDTIF